MKQQATRQRDREQQGFVVWDQQGLVVRWPDGYSSRLSWETLRHVSLCEACHEQSHQPSSAAHQSGSAILSPTV
jgi:DUF971 family protein